MTLRIEDSETAKLIIHEESIRIAKKMFQAGMDRHEIMYYTELSEEEFEQEVANKNNECDSIVEKQKNIDRSHIGSSLPPLHKRNDDYSKMKIKVNRLIKLFKANGR